MWTQTTHPSSHSPGYAASQYRRTGLHVQWRWSQICLFHRCKAPPMHDRGEHITPSSAHEGERVILEVRKRDRIRNQVLARFLTRARSYACKRACRLASASIMRWYTCARERLCLRQCCTRARGAKSLADEHSMIKRSRTDAVLVTSLEINEYLGLRPAYRIQMTSWWWHRVQISVEIHLNEQTQELFHLDRKVRRYFDWVNVRWVNKAIKTAMWFHSTWMRCVLKRIRSWGFYAFQYSVCDENKERENEISYAFA